MTISRGKLLAAGSAAGVFGSAMMGPFLRAAQAAGESDVDLLNLMITIERAGIKAYVDAAATNLLAAPVLQVAKGFMQDHTAHRDALTAAVAAAHGTLTTETAKIPYPSLKTQNDILAFAETVERTAASSYLDTIPKFKDRNLARLAASILGVETTHVTILEYTLKKNTEPYNDFVV